MPRIRRCLEQNPASSGPPWCTSRRVMKTESTLYFDGQFWVGVIERHEADRVRAVRIVFGVQPLVASVASFRFQAGEAAFLFSFLTFLLPGRGSSFSCRTFAFCLNRCL